MKQLFFKDSKEITKAKKRFKTLKNNPKRWAKEEEKMKRLKEEYLKETYGRITL